MSNNFNDIIDIMKICTNPNCTQINPQELTAFHKKKSAKDGLISQCKICRNSSNEIYRKVNPEKEKVRGVNYRKANKEKVNAKNTAWNKANPERVKFNQAAWQKANPEKVRANDIAWKKANPEKSKSKSLRWQKAHPGKANSRTAKRHAQKLNATPKCLTDNQLLEIQAFYVEASRLTKETGVPHHVDHIVPLQGDEVSGFHVPWNLQILTASENYKKGNKIIG